MPADPPGWAIASELAKYEELRDKGYITPDQFEAKKAEILSAPG